MAHPPQAQSSFHEGRSGGGPSPSTYIPSPAASSSPYTREESARHGNLSAEGTANQNFNNSFFDGSNFWGGGYTGDPKDRSCCLQSCIYPRGGMSETEGGCRWRKSWNHFVEMARITWSCKDTRHKLDPESLERMKSTYWLTRVVRKGEEKRRRRKYLYLH